MSESLREQMLKAGFKSTEPAVKKTPTHRPKSAQGKAQNGTRSQNQKANGAPPKKSYNEQKRQASLAQAEAQKRQALATKQEADAIAEKKALKAKIKALIEENHVEKYAGETTHGYILGTRIKQLFVTEEVHRRLVAGELIITRLNGSTHVVPTEIGDQILALNPNWVVVKNTHSDDPVDDDYADFQVPDDLQW